MNKLAIQDRVAAAAADKNRLNIPRHKVDAIDVKILSELQENDRLTNVDLSKRVGITPPPCLRRMRTLEENGTIRGYRAHLDAKKLGFMVDAFVFVGLVSQAKPDIQAFERRMLAWPTVRECHALSGEIDFLLRCVARDLAEFQHFVTETLMKTPSVETVKSALAIRTTKDASDVPLFGIEMPPPLHWAVRS